MSETMSFSSDSTANLDVELLFPPTWSVFSAPHLAFPLLKGFLRERGIASVIRDINLLVVRDFFTPRHMDRVAEEIDFRIRCCRETGKTADTFFQELVICRELALYGRDHIGEPFSRIKENFSTEDRAVFQYCSRAISVLFYPTIWNINESTFETVLTFRHPTIDNALAAARDDDINIFGRYFAQRLPSLLLAREKKVTGITVINPGQLIPALTLALLVRRLYPAGLIVIGGSHVPYLWENLFACPGFFDVVDAVVAGPGEEPLYRIIDRYRRGQPLAGILNTVYRDPQGIVVGSWEKAADSPVRDGVAPDYTGLPVNAYLHSLNAISYRTARRCYWNRCAFCSRANARFLEYRPKKAQAVIDDLRELCRQYGALHVDFVDESISIPYARQLAGLLLAEHLPVTSQFLARFDCKFSEEDARILKKSGVLWIRWGLESASERILKRMDKGISLAYAALNLRNASDAGIWNHVFLITGFPGESDEDFSDTIAFIEDNLAYIDSLSISEYHAEQFSAVSSHPSEFGVELEAEEGRVSYKKTLKIRSGGVPKAIAEERKNALYARIMHTHIGPNFFEALPSSTLLKKIRNDGKSRVREWMLSLACERERRNAGNLRKNIRYVFTGNVRVGTEEMINEESGPLAVRPVILPQVREAFLIEQALLDELCGAPGMPAETFWDATRWSRTEILNRMYEPGQIARMLVMNGGIRPLEI